MAAKNQSPSRKCSCPGCLTNGRCACRTSARKPEAIADCGEITIARLVYPQSAVGDPQSSERPAKILEAIQPFFDDVDACGVTEPDGAVVAESSAGNDSDTCFAQQAIGEILRSQSELANVHEHIERALRPDRGHVWNLQDAIEHIIAAHIELLAHVGERLLVAFQGGERGLLRERGSIRRAVVLNRVHG